MAMRRLDKPPGLLNEAEFQEFNAIQTRLMLLAANARYIGHESGWTRADLAERMGTSTATIHRAFTDADDLSIERLATFALACGYKLNVSFEPNPDSSHPDRRMGPSRRIYWHEEPPVIVEMPRRKSPKHRWMTYDAPPVKRQRRKKAPTEPAEPTATESTTLEGS